MKFGRAKHREHDGGMAPPTSDIPHEVQVRMCRAKRRFSTENEAIDAVILWQQKGVFLRGRVYRCPVCDGFHVTTGRWAGR